jgi:hypothetical protein
MGLVSFLVANDVGDRFLDLLARHGISPPVGSKLETELLSISQLLEVVKNPSAYSSDEQVAVLRAAAGVHDLAAKVLSVEPTAEFDGFIPHLRLITDRKVPSASIRQNAAGAASDDTSRKMAELYMGCLAAHVGREVVLDSPTAAKGDNPDVIFQTDPDGLPSRLWALAIKTISSRQGQTIYDRIVDGARQIDRFDCPAEVGIVVINTKGALDHDALWNSVFANEDHAGDAMKAQVFDLIAAAEKDRDAAEWSAVFSGRTVRPVLFLAQSLVSLPTPAGLRTPTALKMLFAHSFGEEPDAEAHSLAIAMNGFMHSVLLGNPGRSGTMPS